MKAFIFLIVLACVSFLVAYFWPWTDNKEDDESVVWVAPEANDSLESPDEFFSEFEGHAVEQSANEPYIPAAPPGAIKGDLTLTYPDEASALAALERLRSGGIKITGYNKALKTIRVRANDSDLGKLAGLAGDDATPGYNFSVSTPTPPSQTKTGGGTQAFGANAIKWMGGGDKSLGSGVTVAVIDSGVQSHPNLGTAVVGKIDIQKGPEQIGHGTAVASLIAGQSEQAPGIAPAANILSVQVMDPFGASDTYAVAEGIVAAVDADAQIINLSLGSYGDSAVLQSAVEYAQSAGVILVASTGNDATGTVVYPAAYEGVIGVASVDAAGQSATFSNYGEGVDISAPGVAVTAAWDADQYVEFSGTSASAPLVSGALAALLSENPNMTSQQAVDVLLTTANDSGAPGTDEYLGAGSANLDRMLNYNTANRSDIAVADHYLSETDNGAVSVLVTVQNRGTTWSGNMELEVAYEGRTQTYYLNGLNPGQTVAQEILLNQSLIQSDQPAVIQSRVTSHTEDINPDDNSRVTRISIQPSSN